MLNNIKSVLLITCFGFSAIANAQRDTTLNREV